MPESDDKIDPERLTLDTGSYTEWQLRNWPEWVRARREDPSRPNHIYVAARGLGVKEGTWQRTHGGKPRFHTEYLRRDFVERMWELYGGAPEFLRMLEAPDPEKLTEA